MDLWACAAEAARAMLRHVWHLGNIMRRHFLSCARTLIKSNVNTSTI